MTLPVVILKNINMIPGVLYICVIIISFAGLSCTNQAGYYCGNTTLQLNLSNKNVSDVYNADNKCVPCFIQQNCLANNTCLEGTYGDTCERCMKQQYNGSDYYRVGNTCVRCNKIPWATVAFGVYLLTSGVVLAINGLTVSVYTKLKITCHFIQLTYLSFMIKVNWSEVIQQTMAVTVFSCFNANIVNIECLFPKLPPIVVHYLEWATSVLIVMAAFFVALFVDRSMGLVLSREKDVERKDKIWKKRSTFRRLTFFVLLMMYMSVAITALHSFSCSETVPYDVVFDQTRDVFLYEQNESCDAFVFQALHFFATVLLIVFVIFFPLMVILFTLRQRKWSLLEDERIHSGYIYDSFRQRWCFWEAIPMLRKLFYILITDTYPLSSFIQSSAHLSVTGAYLLCIITLRPYRCYNWRCASKAFNIHVLYEVTCNTVLCLIQTVALMTSLDLHLPALDYVVVSCVAAVVLTGILILLTVPLEVQKDQGKLYDTNQGTDENTSDSDDNTPVGVIELLRLRKVKVEPTADEDRETKQKNISF